MRIGVTYLNHVIRLCAFLVVLTLVAVAFIIDIEGTPPEAPISLQTPHISPVYKDVVRQAGSLVLHWQEN